MNGTDGPSQFDVAAARGGDEAAWNRLVANMGPRLRRVCRSFRLQDHDTDEVVQQTWLICWQKIDGLRDDRSFPGWLTAICRRECLRVMGQHRRCVVADLPEIAGAPVDGADVTAVVKLARQQVLLSMKSAVDRLPPAQKRMVEALCSPDFMGYRDLASQLGVPIGSIGPTRTRALERLRRDSELSAWRAEDVFGR